MKQELLSQGYSIINDPECGKNPIHFISSVLRTREQYGNTIQKSFRGDKSFQRALKEAFETFLNVNENPARYLSKYVDLYMKGKIAIDRDERRTFSNRKTHHLDRVIEIFRYLRDRDIFENLYVLLSLSLSLHLDSHTFIIYRYKTTLAKRLLSGRSNSDSEERGMITRLKTECGYQFASKMEGMWKDIKSISRQVNQRYEAWMRRNHSEDESDNVKINIYVLTTGFWPTTSSKISADPTILPDSVVSACEHFHKFYSTHFTGRRLVWNKAMGQAVLYYRMDNKKQKELIVSTYQMCVLMLFNDEGT